MVISHFMYKYVAEFLSSGYLAVVCVNFVVEIEADGKKPIEGNRRCWNWFLVHVPVPR